MTQPSPTLTPVVGAPSTITRRAQLTGIITYDGPYQGGSVGAGLGSVPIAWDATLGGGAGGWRNTNTNAALTLPLARADVGGASAPSGWLVIDLTWVDEGGVRQSDQLRMKPIAGADGVLDLTRDQTPTAVVATPDLVTAVAQAAQIPVKIAEVDAAVDAIPGQVAAGLAPVPVALADIAQTAQSTEAARQAMLDAGAYANLPSVAARADLPPGRPNGELRTVRGEYAIYRSTDGTTTGWVLDTQLQRELSRATWQITQADLTATATTPRPMVVFQADDARVETTSWMEAVFVAAGVPCTLPVISDLANDGLYYLSWDEIRRLQNVRGWEILSHTVTHPRLADVSFTQVETEARDSLAALRAQGLTVESFVAPYGSDSRAVRQALRRSYRSASRTGSSQVATAGSPINQFRVQRTSFDANTLANCKASVDLAKTNNQLVIFTIHPFYDEYTTSGTAAQRRQDLADLLAYCAAQGVSVVNMRDALAVHGNVLDTGDDEGGYLRVARGGAIGSSVLTTTGEVLVRASRTAISPVTDFPAGRQSVMVVYYADAQQNWPGFSAGSNGAGVLLTDRTFTDGAAPRFQTQEFYPYSSIDKWRRYWDGAAWSAWTKLNGSSGGGSTVTLGALNGRTGTEVPSTFAVGIEYTSVQTASAANLPSATGGTLMTVRANNAATSFTYQMYVLAGSNKQYLRTGKSDDTWQAWLDLTPTAQTVLVTLAGYQAYAATAGPSDYPTGRITHHHVQGASAAGWPEGLGGEVITDRLNTDSAGYATQQYRIVGANRTYERRGTGASTWTTWALIAAAPSALPVSQSIAAQSIPAQGVVSVTVAMPGAVYGQCVVAAPQSTPLEAGLVWNAHVAGTDTVTLRLANITSATLATAVRTWKFVVVG